MCIRAFFVVFLAAASSALSINEGLYEQGCGSVGITGDLFPTNLEQTVGFGCGNIGVTDGFGFSDGNGCDSFGIPEGTISSDASLLGGLEYGNVGVLSSVVGNSCGAECFPTNLVGYNSGCGKLPSIAGPQLVAREVVLPSPPSAPLPAVSPRVISNKCNCVKTVVRSQPIKQLVNVPVRRQFTQTFTRPTYQTVTYRTKGPTGPLATASIGLAEYGYPQVDLFGASALENPIVSPLDSSCLPLIPSCPTLPVC